MKNRIFIACAVLCLILSPPVFADDASDLLTKGVELATQQHFTEAIVILKQAQDKQPANADITLAIARTYSWQGAYDKADKILNSLPLSEQSSPDAMFLKANLAYYREDYDRAEKLFESILSETPDNAEAKDGLNKVKRAIKAASSGFSWQADIGHEISNFDRVHQPGWNHSFLQITHFTKNKEWAFHGAWHRYEQYRQRDANIEIGADHRFSKRASGYIWGAITPEANFKPEETLSIGGTIRLDDPSTNWPVAVLATADTKFDQYSSTNSLTLNPGLRLEPYDGWAISSRMISVTPKNTDTLYGWDCRFDGAPLDDLRFYAGLADAPETENNATVSTKTIFGGATVDMTSRTSFRLSYARDDRDNSYIRHIYNVSASFRF
ncbi:MAG: YaiO family outer membrane beta-barrel protein [Alphaproteobacteria bacterium]|nr:YaiO family outer membrane beta-barrel protein [Alphaproteobacteria bacterium]